LISNIIVKSYNKCSKTDVAVLRHRSGDVFFIDDVGIDISDPSLRKKRQQFDFYIIRLTV